MAFPVTSSNIEISDEVLNYRGLERRRVCLQRLNGDTWSVQLARPNETNSTAWSSTSTTLSSRIRNFFNRDSGPPRRILLEMFVRNYEGDRVIGSIFDRVFGREEVRHYDHRSIELSYEVSRSGVRIAGAMDQYDQQQNRNLGELRQDIYRGLNALCVNNGIASPETSNAIQQRGYAQPAQPLQHNPVMFGNVDAILANLNAQPAQPQPQQRLRLYIREDYLKNNPTQVLNYINSQIDGQPEFNQLSVNYTDAEGQTLPGTDVGGISRDFLTKIFRSFVDNGNKSGSPLVTYDTIDDQSGIIPTLNKPEAERNLTALGRLIGICLSNDEYLSGNIFNDHLFAALSNLSAEEALSLIENEPSPEILAKLFKALNPTNYLVANSSKLDELNNEDLKAILEFVYDYDVPKGIFGAEFDAKKTKENINILKAQINKYLSESDDIKNNRRVLGAAKIIGGIASQVGQDYWTNHISNKNPAALNSRAQGAMTKEMILDQVRRTANPQVRGYLLRWVDSNTLERASKLIEAMTGSPTLGPRPLRFQIMAGDTTSLPSFHTCFRQIDLPIHSTYEEFAQKLDISINTSLSQGFDQA